MGGKFVWTILSLRGLTHPPPGSTWAGMTRVPSEGALLIEGGPPVLMGGGGAPHLGGTEGVPPQDATGGAQSPDTDEAGPLSTEGVLPALGGLTTTAAKEPFFGGQFGDD